MAADLTIWLCSRPGSQFTSRTIHTPPRGRGHHRVWHPIDLVTGQCGWRHDVQQPRRLVNLYPSVDAIQEFKVFTGNDEAEYGGAAGTVTNIQLKTGTNALHGDVFEYFRNTAMDARNFFLSLPLPKQVLKQNQFGATLGGPIIKDRTFFFFSYEGLRSIEQTAGLTNVLTPLRQTATSLLCCRQRS